MAISYLVPGWPWYLSDQRLFFGTQEIRRDIATFQPLNEWWGRDVQRVYCAGSEVRAADVVSFRVLNAVYAKDSRKVYTIRGPIREAEDASTFEAIGPTEHAFNATNGYGKDARLVFHTVAGEKVHVIKGADAASFTPRGRGFGSDNSAVYFQRTKLANAEPDEWQHLRGPHSRSERHAYVLGKRIRGANASSLESLPILDIAEYWSRDDNNYYRWDQPADPRGYLDEFRQCFVFQGRVTKVSLTWNSTVSLDPSRSESWAIAQHAWVWVECKEWIQKPDLDVAVIPQLGESFKCGEGVHLGLLEPPVWREEDRIWIFKPVQDHRRVERRLVLSRTMTWLEYSSLDQLDSIKKTVAAAASA